MFSPLKRFFNLSFSVLQVFRIRRIFKINFMLMGLHQLCAKSTNRIISEATLVAEENPSHNVGAMHEPRRGNLIFGFVVVSAYAFTLFILSGLILWANIKLGLPKDVGDLIVLVFLISEYLLFFSKYSSTALFTMASAFVPFVVLKYSVVIISGSLRGKRSFLSGYPWRSARRIQKEIKKQIIWSTIDITNNFCYLLGLHFL